VISIFGRSVLCDRAPVQFLIVDFRFSIELIYDLRFLLLIILAAVAFVSHTAHAQRGYAPAVDDSAVVFPAWVDSVMRRHLIGNLRWEAWTRYSPAQRDTLLDGLPIAHELRPRTFSIPQQWSWNESVHLLAWSSTVRRWIDTRSPDPDLPRVDRGYTFLYCIQLDDTLRRRRWVLAVGTLHANERGEFNVSLPRFTTMLDSSYLPNAIAKARSRHLHEDKGPPIPPSGTSRQKPIGRSTEKRTPRSKDVQSIPVDPDSSPRVPKHGGFKSPAVVRADPHSKSIAEMAGEDTVLDARMKLFKRAPTTADIYSFLDTLLMRADGRSRSARDFFDPQVVAKLDIGEVFLGGDVREDAWCEVTGEEPALWFPGED
jgi:hypothetical protein